MLNLWKIIFYKFLRLDGDEEEVRQVPYNEEVRQVPFIRFDSLTPYSEKSDNFINTFGLKGYCFKHYVNIYIEYDFIIPTT